MTEHVMKEKLNILIKRLGLREHQRRWRVVFFLAKRGIWKFDFLGGTLTLQIFDKICTFGNCHFHF